MMNPAELANIAAFEQEFWWYRGMEQILFHVLDPLAGRVPRGHTLESGCGTGYNSRRFEERYGWRMVPTDLERTALVYAARQGCSRLAQANAAALPFPDRAFDTVVSLDMMVYIPHGEESRVFGELVRVLAPGGLLVLRTAALEILRSHHAEFTGERQRFTRAAIIKLAVEHGLRVLRCTYANSLLMPVALAKFRLLEPLAAKLARKQPESGVQPVSAWLNRLLYSVLELEARWLGAGRNLPIGQSLILIGERCA